MIPYVDKAENIRECIEYLKQLGTVAASQKKFHEENCILIVILAQEKCYWDWKSDKIIKKSNTGNCICW